MQCNATFRLICGNWIFVFKKDSMVFNGGFQQAQTCKTLTSNVGWCHWNSETSRKTLDISTAWSCRSVSDLTVNFDVFFVVEFLKGCLLLWCYYSLFYWRYWNITNSCNWTKHRLCVLKLTILLFGLCCIEKVLCKGSLERTIKYICVNNFFLQLDITSTFHFYSWSTNGEKTRKSKCQCKKVLST